MQPTPHRTAPFIRAVVHAAIGVATALSLAGTAASQDKWPSRPVKLVVPYGAGGGVDQTVRLMAEKLGTAFGQPFVVENRAGGNTIIAAEAVAKSPADGYTFLTPAPAVLTVNPSLFAKLPYAVSDFTPVAMFGRIPLFIVVGPDSPVKNLQELLAKGRKEELTYASAGNGSMTHLGTELIKMQTGVKAVHVPFKGTAAAMPEVISGRIDFALTDLGGSAKGLIDGGKLRVLSASSATRSSLMPSASSLSDNGVKDIDIVTWVGLAAPKGVPQDIVARLSAEVNKILADPAMQKQLLAAGLEANPMSPAQFGQLITDEGAKWKQVIAAGNIKPE